MQVLTTDNATDKASVLWYSGVHADRSSTITQIKKLRLKRYIRFLSRLSKSCGFHQAQTLRISDLSNQEFQLGKFTWVGELPCKYSPLQGLHVSML